MTDDRIRLTMSSRPTGALAYGFARILEHGVSGVRYYEHPAPERKSARAVFTKTPTERPPPQPRSRWTPERLAALPQTSGLLTRIDVVSIKVHGTAIVLACAGQSPECRKRVTVPAAAYARDTRPRSCKGCSRAHSRAQYGNAFTDKGYANARAFAEASKRRQDEPEAAE